MGKINILNDSGNAKATLEFNGSSDIEVNADSLKSISSTDNAVARFNGTTGQLQGSGVTIDDTGTITAGRSATQGSVLLYNNYADTDKLNIFGSKYSSGSTIMSYGVRNDSTGWVSTYDNFVGNRGALTIDASLEFLSANGNLGTTVGDNLNLETRFKIDSSGRVTMPYQPAFSARFNVSPPVAQVGVISRTLIFDEVNINIGNHYNATTGAFTAPISGLYRFYTARSLNTQGADQNIRHPSMGFNKNGVYYSGINTGVSSSSGLSSSDYMHFNVNFEDSIYLNAGDYVDVHFSYNNSPSVLHEYAASYFSGHLIG